MVEIDSYKRNFKEVTAKESRRCKIYSLKAKEAINVIKERHQDLLDTVDTLGFNNPKAIKKLREFIDQAVTHFKNQVDCQEEETAKEILAHAHDVLKNTFTADFPDLQFKLNTCAANFENALGNNKASLDYLKQALRYAEEFEKTTRNYIDLNTAQTYLNVANNLFYQARYQEAKTYAERAEEAANRSIAQLKDIQTSVNLKGYDGMDPEDVESKIIIRLDVLIMSWLLQGKTLEKLNMFDRAAMCLRSGKHVLVENLGPQHPLNADFDEVLAIVDKQLQMELEIYNIDESQFEEKTLLGEPILNTYTRTALMQKGRILGYREKVSETVQQQAKTLEELKAEYEAGLEKTEDDHQCRRRLKALIQKRQMIDQQFQFEEMMLMMTPIQTTLQMPQHQQPFEEDYETEIVRKKDQDAGTETTGRQEKTNAQGLGVKISDGQQPGDQNPEQIQKQNLNFVNPIPLSDEWATDLIEFTTEPKTQGLTVYQEKFSPDENLEKEELPTKAKREKSQFTKNFKVITEDHEMFKTRHSQSHSEIMDQNTEAPEPHTAKDNTNNPEGYRKHIWQIVHDMVKDIDTTNQSISDEDLKLIIEWEARQIMTAGDFSSREIVYITDLMEPKTDAKVITLNHLLPPGPVFKTQLVKMNLKALAKIQAYVRGFCVRAALKKFEWDLVSDWLFKDEVKEQYYFVKVFKNNGAAVNANYKVVVSSKRFLDNMKTKVFESLPCLDQEVQVYFKKALTIDYDNREECLMVDFKIATLPVQIFKETLLVKKSGMEEVQIGDTDFITNFKEPPAGFRGTIEIRRFRLLDKWTVSFLFVAEETTQEEKDEKKGKKKGEDKGKKEKKDKEKGKKQKKDKAPKDKKEKKDKSKSKDKKKDPKSEKSSVKISRFFRVEVSFFHAASRLTTSDYINLLQLPTQLRYMVIYLRDHLHVYMNESDTAINYAALQHSRSNTPFENTVTQLEQDFFEKAELATKKDIEVKPTVKVAKEETQDTKNIAFEDFGQYEISREGIVFVVQVRYIKSLKMPWRIFVFQKTNLNNSDYVQLSHLQERDKELEKFLRQKLCIYFDPMTKLIDYVCLTSLKNLQKPPLVQFQVYHKKRWFTLMLEQNDDDPQEPFRLTVQADNSDETAAHQRLKNIATQNKRALCSLYGDNILLSSRKNAQDYSETVINYKKEFGKVVEEQVTLTSFMMVQDKLEYSVEVIKKKHAVNSWNIIVTSFEQLSFGIVLLDELEVSEHEREAFLRENLKISLYNDRTIKSVHLTYPFERMEISVDVPKDKKEGIPDWVLAKLQLRGLQIRLKKLKAQRENALICRFKIFKQGERQVEVLIEVRIGIQDVEEEERDVKVKTEIDTSKNENGDLESSAVKYNEEVINENRRVTTSNVYEIQAINLRNPKNVIVPIYVEDTEMQLPKKSVILDYLRKAVKLRWSNDTTVEKIDFVWQDQYVTDMILFRCSLNVNRFLSTSEQRPSWLQVCSHFDEVKNKFYSLWIDADLKTDQVHCQVNIFNVNQRDVRDQYVKGAPIMFKLREVYDLFYPHNAGVEGISYLEIVTSLEVGRFYFAWKKFLSFFDVKHTGNFDKEGFIKYRKSYFSSIEANKTKKIDGLTLAGVVENQHYEQGLMYFIISCPKADSFKFSVRTEDDDEDFEQIKLKSFRNEHLEHARNQPVDTMIAGFELLLQQKLEAEMTIAAQKTTNSFMRVREVVEKLKKNFC